MALARLSIFKCGLYMNETTTAYDAQYKIALKQASHLIENLVGRRLLRHEIIDEEWCADGSKRWYPRERPIESVAYIKYEVSGASLGAALYSLREPIYTDSGVLVGYNFIRYAGTGGWQENLELVEGSDEYTGGWRNNTLYLIRYTCGYDDTGWMTAAISSAFGVPSDLEEACCMLAHHKWLLGKGGGGRRGLTSITRGTEGGSMAGFGADLKDIIQAVVNRYRITH